MSKFSHHFSQNVVDFFLFFPRTVLCFLQSLLHAGDQHISLLSVCCSPCRSCLSMFLLKNSKLLIRLLCLNRNIQDEKERITARVLWSS